jgi:hypothetical protein
MAGAAGMSLSKDLAPALAANPTTNMVASSSDTRFFFFILKHAPYQVLAVEAKD